MRFALFYHSLVSDWNHGNAHFLRGIVTELLSRGHQVRVFEPENGWSRQNLIREQGEQALQDFRSFYPHLQSIPFHEETIRLDQVLKAADVVIVHEWNSPHLVRRIGEHHAADNHYRLLFHDTHHRSVTDPRSMGGYDLRFYDGVLAFGGVIGELYLRNGWTRRAWTWHEAADTRVFHPVPGQPPEGDLIWLGNWGDEERSAEIREFLIEPVKRLKLRACVYGVRYPPEAVEQLKAAGIEYRGWLPNFRVPETFARFKATVHIPRRPYTTLLPGIPTIRVFEALACGIPLISAWWPDAERLFTPGSDYLVARDGVEMAAHLARVLCDAAIARALIVHGLQTIRERHTCAQRADQLLSICAKWGAEPGPVSAVQLQKEQTCLAD